jgi:hypothetical protein
MSKKDMIDADENYYIPDIVRCLKAKDYKVFSPEEWVAFENKFNKVFDKEEAELLDRHKEEAKTKAEWEKLDDDEKHEKSNMNEMKPTGWFSYYWGGHGTIYRVSKDIQAILNEVK